MGSVFINYLVCNFSYYQTDHEILLQPRVVNDIKVDDEIKEAAGLPEIYGFNAGFFGWGLTESHPFYKTFLLWKEMKTE